MRKKTLEKMFNVTLTKRTKKHIHYRLGWYVTGNVLGKLSHPLYMGQTLEEAEYFIQRYASFVSRTLQEEIILPQPANKIGAVYFQ